jgi:nucleotide-binding universal stress UspA family protein
MNKSIVVGIDFSDCSINALEHAISIAQKSKSNLTMVWANHLDYSKEIFSVEPKQLDSEVKTRFDGLVAKYQDSLKGLKLDYVLRKGKVYKEICAVAADIDAFVIVIGTHGSTGFEEFWIGSNANRIVASSPIPVITIRGGIDIGRDMQKIVLPFDSTKATRQKLPITALFAKYFRSEVHIVGIFTSSLDDQQYRVRNYVAQAEDYLKENFIRYKISFIEAENITEATLDYAKSIDANLISIMTEQETATSNLWMGPFASQMVNHSPIPVLSVKPDTYDSYN